MKEKPNLVSKSGVFRHHENELCMLTGIQPELEHPKPYPQIRIGFGLFGRINFDGSSWMIGRTRFWLVFGKLYKLKIKNLVDEV